MFCIRCHRAFPEGETHCDRHGDPLVDRLLPYIDVKATDRAGMLIADRYVLRGVIGEGGSGRVYLAEDRQTQKPVAVKMPDLPRGQRKAAAARFLREAEVAKIIDHPNVVDTFFAGELPDGTPVIVMEYLFGETLGALTRRQGPLAVPVVLSIVRDIASALGAAHNEGIFHRDIKPDNVFLLGEPGNHHGVKIVDFGLAKVRAERRTSTGTTLGTVEFMAPEQCVADPSDSRTDIYGLGAVMYRLLTGHLPFVDRQVEALLAKQLIEAPVPVRHLAPTVPLLLERLVLKCLRKDPARRPSSMGELESELSTMLRWVKGQDPKPDAPPLSPEENATDVYVPRGYSSKLVASALYRKLGRVPPDFVRPDAV